MADQPNIIFIITDQQRYDTINALGFPFVDTPHMDRLVREGVSFSNCHVAAPSCASSRASLFTGYFPHTTGILKNADAWRRSWVNQLADAGYHCVNVGKMHTWPFQTPCGFHERYVVENKDRFLEGRYYFDEWDKALAARGLVKQQRELYREYENYHDALGAFTWDLPEETHSDFFVGDFAQWWLRTKPVDKPLFLQIGFPGPIRRMIQCRGIWRRMRVASSSYSPSLTQIWKVSHRHSRPCASTMWKWITIPWCIR